MALGLQREQKLLFFCLWLYEASQGRFAVIQRFLSDNQGISRHPESVAGESSQIILKVKKNSN